MASSERNSMAEKPVGTSVRCPECNAPTIAIIPRESDVTEQEAEADGSVWVTCSDCGERFLVYYRS